MSRSCRSQGQEDMSCTGGVLSSRGDARRSRRGLAGATHRPGMVRRDRRGHSLRAGGGRFGEPAGAGVAVVRLSWARPVISGRHALPAHPGGRMQTAGLRRSGLWGWWPGWVHYRVPGWRGRPSPTRGPAGLWTSPSLPGACATVRWCRIAAPPPPGAACCPGTPAIGLSGEQCLEAAPVGGSGPVPRNAPGLSPGPWWVRGGTTG
jgi:hypothetical protein